MSLAPIIKYRSTFLILILLALLVPVLAYSVLRLEGPRIRSEALANLAAIGRLKADQIETWLSERRGDAEVIMASESYINDVQLWFDHRDPGAWARLAQREVAMRRAYGYQRVELLDARAPPDTLAPARRALLVAALASGQVQTSDLYRDSAGQIWLDFVAPLIKHTPTGQQAVGAVVLHSLASAYLFPLIQTWPTASPSAETLLVRRDGNSVLFHNDLRHRQGSALTLRLPLDLPDLPAAVAARDKQIRTFEGHDYRGTPVLAAVRPVKGTDWSLVAKVDMDEVQQPFYQLVKWIGMVALVASVVLGFTLLKLWRQKTQSHRMELIAQTAEKDRLLKLFYDLPFMGMGIVDPDSRRWLHVNDRLCEILGYSREELLASPTCDQLTHPDDLPREMAQLQRLLAGEIEHYQMEKRFCRKDDGFIDVALSVKCVRRGDGSMKYTVKTVRDISDRKRLEVARAEQQRSSSLLDAIANTSSDTIFVKDLAGLYLFYNRAAAHEVNQRSEDVIGRDDTALYPAEQAAQLMAVDREVIASGEPVTFEEKLTTSYGERTFFTTKGPLLDSVGKAIGLYGISRDITERKLVEKALAASGARLSGVIESAMDAIISVDAAQRVRLFNPAAERIFACTRVDALGQPIERFIPARFRQAHAGHLRQFAATGVTSRSMGSLGELFALRGDGSEFPIEASISQADIDGEKLFTVILRDITERKRAEAALRYQLDLTRSIMEKATDSIFINDAEGRVIEVNAEAEKTFGYSADELKGQVLHDLIHHHHRDGRLYPMSECPLCHVYHTGEIIRDHEAILFRKDGSRLFVTGTSAALESGGKLLGAALILHDISERKQAEQALREREEDLNRAQVVGHIGSWRLDVHSNELTWSAENYRIFGVAEGTPMTYQTFLACVHPDDQVDVDQAWQAGLHGEPYDIQHRLLVDGTVKWVREKAALEFDPGGNLLGGFGITQDITDTKSAEQALRDSEERFQLTAEIGHSGTWDWNVQSGEVIWSRGHYEILGYQVEGVPSSYQAWINRVHPEDRARIEAEICRCMQERVDYAVEFRIVWPDASIHWMSARGRYEYGQDGICQRMVGVMADITSLKQAELALREADQRKDEFLAMLAHELRNPLAPIRNAAHVIGRLDLAEPRLRWAQDIIERQVNHLTHLVDELLDVSRIVQGKIVLKKTRVDLADLIRQTCESVQSIMTAKGHRFEVRMPAARVVLDGDLVRLVQILQNLLNNAAKYTPDSGHIELLGRLRESEIEIVVRDDGMGISAELLPVVFDLFRQGNRTLDRSQGGLGIGLTLVRQLVGLHGGHVTVASRGPGQGASFSVRLPLAAGSDPVPAPAGEGRAGAAAGPALRVLVVEDDPVVAESMVVFLELDGYQVRSAAAAEAALDLLTEFRPQVALIDIGLPGQDGYALAERIRQRADCAGLKLIAVSGYGHAEAMQRSHQVGFDQHLVKPVDPEMLCTLLAEIGRLVTGQTTPKP